jgi:hypothetical protein
MMNVFWIIIAIVIISSLVGALAKFLNNMNEMQAARNRPPAAGGPPPGGGPVVRQSTTDMDRFLAEIDRLRRKNAEATGTAPNQPAIAPVVQPAKQPERPRARVVAELAEPVSRPDVGFDISPPPPPLRPSEPPQARVSELPVATVVTPPPSGTGAPATRVTRIAGRPRPAAKTNFAKNLTTILNSGQGLALSIVLQEILGPPSCKKR